MDVGIHTSHPGSADGRADWQQSGASWPIATVYGETTSSAGSPESHFRSRSGPQTSSSTTSEVYRPSSDSQHWWQVLLLERLTSWSWYQATLERACSGGHERVKSLWASCRRLLDCSWILQSSSRSCRSSHLSPVPWKCVCAFVHVSWTSQMTLRFSTDFWAKVASWLAPNCVHSGCVFLVNASHDKVCTTWHCCNGDGVGEWAASVRNWQTWASSWCGTSAWEAGARPTCPCAIQWTHLCRSAVLRDWCWASVHHTCLILVIGLFSVTFQWHMAQSPFRVV